ncbi:winged helix-turn-helix transcriptional regulator [Candidatus Woesearchaeota archaeon]|nr:winged helix-turn-helix transcriptional regulator [Candidatus Woesearchaeota archaeon]
MAKNNLLLIDLSDARVKNLAETITSDTSRKILNHLAEKEDTEANISKKLGMPISTVHYHLQKLQEASLVVVDEYHYSEKGREVNHYKLANKYIIIAPKKVTGIKQKLKNILPVALITLAAGALLKLYTYAVASGFGRNMFMAATKDSALQVADKAAPVLQATKETAEAATPIALETAGKTAETISNLSNQPDIALWFLIGAVSTMAVYLVVSIIKDWLRNRE